jgi:heme/copper-type cytochrome/quinol oxidase subunit 2
MYLIISAIIFVAAVCFGSYDPETAERLSDGDLSIYYFYSIGVAIAWPVFIIAIIFGVLGYGAYLIGKRLRKK